MNIVILTGAGISAESGIQTFRASDGLWENHKIEDVATPEGFNANPDLVHAFYNKRRAQLLSDAVKENTAHLALGQLQASAHNVTLVTQNIDDLHERGGATDVIHMHGELLKMRCKVTQQVFDIDTAAADFDVDSRCECCQVAGNLRPHIVWFGEMPFAMERIEQALFNADLFVSIGTSGNVYPAAGFVQLAKNVGAKTLEVNLEASAVNQYFDHHRYGKATELLPILVEDILSGKWSD